MEQDENRRRREQEREEQLEAYNRRRHEEERQDIYRSVEQEKDEQQRNAYHEAEKKIEALQHGLNQTLDLSSMNLITLPESIGQLTQLQSLNLYNNQLTKLPDSFGNLKTLRFLDLYNNQLTYLPTSFGNLTQLKVLDISKNELEILPDCLSQLSLLEWINVSYNKLVKLPHWIGEWVRLQELYIGSISSFVPGRDDQVKRWLDEFSLRKNKQFANQIKDLPETIIKLEHLQKLNLDNNPLNPELAIAYKQGLDAIRTYFRAKAASQIAVNETKLILVGEGEVGKSCLLGALRGESFIEGLPTTHGIEIKSVKVIELSTHKIITLNGWDFGGQRVYRPTHQLFFSAPAIYLVVWKPREGSQQGLVKEWIKLVKYREPDAKIIVVATHGGPQQRQPDIDRQELWDLFGKDTVIDFFHVDSKPDANGQRRGIQELKHAIASIANNLPEMGRSVPKRWQDARKTLEESGVAYLPLERVLDLCRQHGISEDEARLFVIVEHRLGHLIHYQHDPTLRNIVVLKPNWLATAISFVLDNQIIREAHGLVRFTRLSQLWDDPMRSIETRYPENLHRIFVRLMERFDLCYRVTGLSPHDNSDPAYLIAQLVPDTRPENDLAKEWPTNPQEGDNQQVQICCIVDEKGQSTTAEGLFYQLIVRLHRYSLGRNNYNESVHWQRGLILDDDYNGRALLEYIGSNIRITVRASYPEFFLAKLTGEVKYLVESFWEGLHCDVMVPCVNPCGKNQPGNGLFEVQKLIAFKRQGMTKFPCLISGCNQIQDIDGLLRNAPVVRSVAVDELFAGHTEIKQELMLMREKLAEHDDKTTFRFERLDNRTRRILSKVDDAYAGLMQALTDESKEGPRLFSLVPIDPSFLNKPKWISQRFRLILWCEHSRLPLPVLNPKGDKHGIYDLDLPRGWVVKAAPFLKVMTTTLSLVLPVALSGIKVAIDKVDYDAFDEYLDFGKECIDSLLTGGERMNDWLGHSDNFDLERGRAIEAKNSALRQLHAILKAKDPGFGGLVRVMNKRQEFLWVHPQFEKEY